MLLTFFVVLVLLLATYPILCLVLGFSFKKNREETISIIELQPISIILAVYNEEKNIERKILELLNEPIWVTGSELIIVSGGSNDKTNEIISKFANNSFIKAIFIKEQIQKIESINLAVTRSQNETLVFSDCRQYLKVNSIFELVTKIQLEQVDVAVATLENKNKSGSFIRKMLNKMNLIKSVKGNAMNVYGALYAQKKSTFSEIPQNILFDDLYVLAYNLAHKRTIKQIDSAIIIDANFNDYYQEERIQRLTRGLLLFFFRHFSLIRKMPLKDKFHFLMSKYAKLLVPLFLLVIFFISCFEFLSNLSNPNIYSLFFVLSLVILGFSKSMQTFIKVAYYTLKAEYLYLFKNKRSVRWEKFTNY